MTLLYLALKVCMYWIYQVPKKVVVVEAMVVEVMVEVDSLVEDFDKVVEYFDKVLLA